MSMLFKRLVSEEKGQGLVEYALIIGLIAIVAIGVLQATGTSVKDIFTTIKDQLNTVSTPTGG